MDKSIQEKQQYLRKNIREKNYDVVEYINFLNNQIPIGDNLELIKYEELVKITEQFISIKEATNNQLRESMLLQPLYKGPYGKSLRIKESTIKIFDANISQSINYAEQIGDKQPKGLNQIKQTKSHYILQPQEEKKHLEEKQLKSKEQQIDPPTAAEKKNNRKKPQKSQSRDKQYLSINYFRVQKQANDTQRLKKDQPRKKPIVFTRFAPAMIQMSFHKTLECQKVVDRFSHIPKINFTVSEPQRINTNGFFGIAPTSFLQFKIQTLELKWSVRRRYSDFVWLRQHLAKIFPMFILPPIPEKKAAKKNKKQIEKRMRILELFLQDLEEIREAFNDRFVEAFLSETDAAKFDNLKNQAEKVKGPNKIEQQYNLQGHVESILSEENKTFLEEMRDKIPDIQRIYKEVTRGGKKLQSLISQQANCLFQIGNYFADLHEKVKSITEKIPKVKPVFTFKESLITMNNMMISWGNIVKQQCQFLETHFITFFKYIRNEFYGYTDVISKQQTFETQYAEVKLVLDKKKDRIFQMHDVKKWELPPSDASLVTKSNIYEKEEAIGLMLPKQTKAAQKMKIQLFYLIQSVFHHGVQKINRLNKKSGQNFQNFSKSLKINNQKMSDLWLQTFKDFSGKKQRPSMLMERLSEINDQDFYNL